MDAGRPQQVGFHVILVGARGSQVRAHVAWAQDGHAHLQVSCKSRGDKVNVIEEGCDGAREAYENGELDMDMRD